MKAVTSAQMRDLDKITIEEFEIPGEELMRRAGRGVAMLVDYLVDRAHYGEPLICIVAGRGNNGGDAFAAACVLHEEDYEVEVLLAGSASEIRGDALKHLAKVRAAGIPLYELPTKERWEEELRDLPAGQVVVDGVLGIGVNGPPRGPAAAAIHYINMAADDNLVVAIDVPSGLNADTGEAPGEAVRADVTVTIGLPKVGLLSPQALPYVGNLEVVSIGIPAELIKPLSCPREFIADFEVRQAFRRRDRMAHKGLYGHLLLMGGAVGYTGAIGLATRAAVRSGVGLVTTVTPESIFPVVASAALEAMVHPGPETETGSLSSEVWAAWSARMSDFDAIALGPGMTRHRETLALVRAILKEFPRPVLLDADALNVLEGHPDWIADSAGPVVITPHPGELARLLGSTVRDIQADREQAARRAAELTGAVVVLKGAGTVVTAPGRTPAINLTGNPGMATGGMGDVLTGLIGGFLAQGLPPFTATCAGVYLHGRAGDNAAWRKSQVGITAGDVIEELPYAFRDIGVR